MANCLDIADKANQGRLSDDQLELIFTELNAERQEKLILLERLKSAIDI
jgi:hypothetical protein